MSHYKDKNHVIALHKQQYATSDLKRHVDLADEGLREHEHFLISKHSRERHLPTLEIGCGAGRISLGMETELGFSNITATDFVEGLVDAARRIVIDKQSSITLKTCSITDLPFEDNSFHNVVCLGVVLSHLPFRTQRIQALKECHRVLGDEGLLYIDARNFLYKHWHMPFRKLLTTLRRAIGNPYGYDNRTLPRIGTGGKFDPMFLRADKPVLYHYCPDELVFDVLSSGFSVVELIADEEMLCESDNEEFCNDGGWICVVGKKIKVAQ